ncbi:MAG: hypothetical protein HY553_12785 [Elusimicrobia bacterium]|nr:hypothetical protein [Elusimicrobiota bacterium]
MKILSALLADSLSPCGRAARLLSCGLAAALVAVSPGTGAYSAFAQMVEAPVAARTLTAPVSVGPVAGVMSPAIVAPSVTAALALPTVAAPVVTASRPLARAHAKASPLAGGIAAASRPAAAALAGRATRIAKLAGAAGNVQAASGESASGFGSKVFSALLGGDVGSVASAVAPAAEDAPERPSGLTPPGVEAAEYRDARRVLSRLATAFGLAFSLPVAGPRLAQNLLNEAKEKKVVFSDFDDTLDKFNAVASPETVAAVVGVLKAGKTVVVITDRPDTKKPGAKNVTILESLESIPAADRAGLWVSANKGGRILRFDEQGEAKLVYEEPALPADEAAKVKDAALAVKARLASLGAELHDGSKNIPSENASNYGYALMLKIGTQEAAVKAVAEAFQEELSQRGIAYEVEPRLAKDPAFPPYVTFSKLDKSLAVRRVAELIKASAKVSLIIGDSMFAPKPRRVDAPAEEMEAARREGEARSGRPEPVTGNGTDRDMEKGLPGALTLSVGTTADPAMANAFVLPGKGPEVTRTVLKAVAEGVPPAPKGDEDDGDIPPRFAIPMIALLAAAGIGGWYAIYYALTKVIEAAGSAPALPIPVAPGGWESLFGVLALGAGMMLAVSRDLPDPKDVYGAALKEARRHAEGRALTLVNANGAYPVRDGASWNFTFALDGSKGTGRSDQITVMMSRGISINSGPYEARAHLYRDAPLPEGAIPFSSEPTYLSMGVKVAPATALNVAQREAGAARGGYSVQLRIDEEPVSGDKDFWYHFYGADRHVAVNARTGEFRAFELPAAMDDGGEGWLARVRRTVSEWVRPHVANWFRGSAPAAETPLTDDDIRRAAASVVGQKGMPWSQTEYNMVLYTTSDRLRERGATDAQMELYYKLCADAPVRGGRFNPWSGD